MVVAPYRQTDVAADGAHARHASASPLLVRPAGWRPRLSCVLLRVHTATLSPRTSGRPAASSTRLYQDGMIIRGPFILRERWRDRSPSTRSSALY